MLMRNSASWGASVAAALLCVIGGWGCAPGARTSQPSATTGTPAEQAAADIPEPLRSAAARTNYYRAMAGVPPVEVDLSLNAGAQKHALYLIKNKVRAYHWYVSNGKLGAGQLPYGAQAESPGNQWYSKEGAKAAKDATVLMGAQVPADGVAFVDQIMSMPFNALAVLYPQFAAMGLGTYCEHDECVAVVAERFGLDKGSFVKVYADPVAARWNPANGPVPQGPARLREPIQFPPPAGSTTLLADHGNGTLDALVSCEGYRAPSGAPIILALGEGLGEDGLVTASKHSLSDSTGPVEHCVIDAANYQNPNGVMQDYGRRWLNSAGAIVMIPRKPLVTGERYAVSITADGGTRAWSFSVAPAGAP